MITRKRRPPAALTPLMRQYRAIKQQYRDCLLFFRLGDFYELFYEDAEVASRELDLVLTTRDRDKPNPVPMCGIPWFASENYIQRLVQKGYKVAVCEQVEDPAKAKGLVKRSVVRVVTPGTYVGPEDTARTAVLAAVAANRRRWGFAWLDVVTGEGAATEWEPAPGEDLLVDLWTRSGADELRHPESWTRERLERWRRRGVTPARWTPLPDWVFDPRYARDAALRILQVETLQAFDLEDHETARTALGAILHYLEETQPLQANPIRNVRYQPVREQLVLDGTTVRNLELVRNAYDGTTRGTLLHTLDRTLTPMGRRLLERWILHPLIERRAIESRLDAVDGFYRRPAAIERLRRILQPIPDLDRVLTRVGFNQAGPRDLALLRQGLLQLPKLREALEEAEAAGILEPVRRCTDLLESLADELSRALVDDPPAVIREPGFIRDGYHPELDELRHAARHGRKFLVEMEQNERRRTGIPNLKIRYNKVFGYYIEVTKTHLDRVPEDYERRQTLTQSERFTTPKLKKLEHKILAAEERAYALEQEIFTALLARVREHLEALHARSADIARVDVVQALADTALRRRYTRPVLRDDLRLDIRNGRHPVIEAVQSDRPFIPNDLALDAESDQILILTGPNMGGKSTYLRQTALICLMAQMGSFVPAENAVVGLVDRIFTRVGASDFLTRAQSTFMVEMLETAYILRHATPRSLVVLDEIGRGTSTFDGMALAWSVLEYLHELGPPGPRTLFATHFHELIHLADLYPRVRNCSVAVKEAGDTVVFLYRVIPGPCDQSYGVHVARLAGVPDTVVDRARAILRSLADLESALEQSIGKATGRDLGPILPTASRRVTRRRIPRLVQRSLIETDPIYGRFEQFVHEIRNLNLDEWSPVQAWQYLDRLQKQFQGETTKEEDDEEPA